MGILAYCCNVLLLATRCYPCQSYSVCFADDIQEAIAKVPPADALNVKDAGFDEEDWINFDLLMSFDVLDATLAYLLQLPAMLLALLALPGFSLPRVAYLQPDLTEALTELICTSLPKKSACHSVWNGMASAD